MFIQAKNYRQGRVDQPSFIVVHTIEAPQSDHTAYDVAMYFHTQTGAPTSAHGIADSGQLIRMVNDQDTAYAAGGTANERGLHLEHAGYAHFTPAEWDTGYTKSMLALGAAQIATWCKAWNIPAVRLSPADLVAGKRGICGHIDVTNAWHETTHWDPGPGFPMDAYIAQVAALLDPATPPPAPKSAKEDDMELWLLSGHSDAFWLSGGKAVASLVNSTRKEFIAQHPERVTSISDAGEFARLLNSFA